MEKSIDTLVPKGSSVPLEKGQRNNIRTNLIFSKKTMKQTTMF